MIQFDAALLDSAALLTVGRIVAGSIAAGLSLYATILILGLISISGLAMLPAGLSGLQNGVVLLTAAVLLIADILADREPAFAGTWNVVHTLIKPAVVTTICIAAVTMQQWPLEAVLCVAAAALTALVHAIRFGQRVARHAPAPPHGSGRISALEAATAAILIILAVRWPLVAAIGGMAGVALLAALTPLRWRAFQLAIVAQRGRVRRLVGSGGWVEYAQLPEWVQRALPAAPTAASPPRGARAAALDLPGISRYRRGWIIATADAAWFLTRRLRGIARIRLPTLRPAAEQPAALGTPVLLAGAVHDEPVAEDRDEAGAEGRDEPLAEGSDQPVAEGGDEPLAEGHAAPQAMRLLLLPDGPDAARLVRALELTSRADAREA